MIFCRFLLARLIFGGYQVMYRLGLSYYHYRSLYRSSLVYKKNLRLLIIIEIYCLNDNLFVQILRKQCFMYHKHAAIYYFASLKQIIVANIEVKRQFDLYYSNNDDFNPDS